MKNKARAERKARPRNAEPRQAAAPVAPDELRRLTDELQRVNRELSRIGRVPRPGADPTKQSRLPEKQELQRRRLELEGKIRTLRTP